MSAFKVMSDELIKDFPDLDILSLTLHANVRITEYEKEVIDLVYNNYVNLFSLDYNLSMEDFMKYSYKLREELINLIRICHNSSLNREESSFRGRDCYNSMCELYEWYRV